MAQLTALKIDPSTLDFDLPEGRIAQLPVEKRDHAKLMVLNRQTGTLDHRQFFQIEDFFKPGDVLVLNKARVNRAKLIGRKKTGGRVEVILIDQLRESSDWRALVRPHLKPETVFSLGADSEVRLKERSESGENILTFLKGDAHQLMKETGKIPLPPYIKREDKDPRDKKDLDEYQTVYSSKPGSLAAPTAGLHFTQELLEKLKAKGVRVLTILLNVGWGTFKPIAGSVDTHAMLAEAYEINRETFAELRSAKKEERPITCVGTTTTRVLESLSPDNELAAEFGETSLFIKPGFKFRWVDRFVTNFHVPRSTPISLTAAFCGLPFLEKAYQEAIDQNYRFFSYGDAMMIL